MECDFDCILARLSYLSMCLNSNWSTVPAGMSIHTADNLQTQKVIFRFSIYNLFVLKSKQINVAECICTNARFKRGFIGESSCNKFHGLHCDNIGEKKGHVKNNNNNKNYETNRTGEIPNKTTLNLQQQLMVVFHPQLQGELHQLQEISQVHETQEVCKHGFKYLRTSRNLSAGGKGGTRILRGNGVGDQSSSTKYKRGTIENWHPTSEEI